MAVIDPINRVNLLVSYSELKTSLSRNNESGNPQCGGLSHPGMLRRPPDMTTSRIEPVSPQRAPRWIRAIYRIARGRYGEVPQPLAVTAHHPGLLLGTVFHETALDRASTKLPANVRELAVYRTARTIGCSWCVDFGAMLARLDGLDVERLTDIDNYATSQRYSADERAAIAYADAMSTDPHRVTDEQVSDLRRRFGDAGVIELTYHIGVENMRARMNAALSITEQGFNSADGCRLRWTADPAASR